MMQNGSGSGVSVPPRWPDSVRLVYPGGKSVEITVTSTMGGIVWDLREAAELAERGLAGTLTTSADGISRIDAPQGYYFWTLEHPLSGVAEALVAVPPAPVEVIVSYGPSTDPRYVDAEHPDGRATTAINVKHGGVKGFVWSVPDAEELETHGYGISNIPDPPDYVVIHSRAPGCTILNGVVVCYA